MTGIVGTQQLMRQTSAEHLGAIEEIACATTCRDVGKTKRMGPAPTSTNETCMAKENSEPLNHEEDGDDGHVKSRRGLQGDESSCNLNGNKAELQRHYSRTSGKSDDAVDVVRQRSNSNSYQNGTTIISPGQRRHSMHGLMTEAERRSPLVSVLLQSVACHTSGPVEDKATGRSDDSSTELQADPESGVCPTGEVKKLKPMKLQFWKTKMCPWVSSIGHCRRGGNCRYAHGQEELRPLPDLTKTKMCEDLATMGKCSNSESCRFAHSMDELRATTSFSKTKLCQQWLQSSCISGPLCRFAHGEHELRLTEGVERKISDRSHTSQGDRKVPADHWQHLRADPGVRPNGNREHNQSMDYPSHPAVRNFRERQPHNESRPDRPLAHHNHDNGLAATSSRPLRPNSNNQQQHKQRHIRHIQSGNRHFHNPSAPTSPEASRYQHQLQVPHPPQQQQRPIIDPNVLFQGLSPMSLRVATNALVYLAESQQQNWLACGNNGGLGSNASMTLSNSASPSHQIRQNRDLRASMGSNDSLPYQGSPSQYAQILYPSNGQSPTLWDSSNSSAAGSTNHLQQNLSSAMLGQSPPQQHLPQHIVGGTPMQFFAHNMSNGIRPPAGFSPMPMGQGTETGRYVATHLLPAGMFSPMGPNQGESGQQQQGIHQQGLHQQGLQQLCLSPGSTQPVDLFLSFPGSADTSHSGPSSNPLDFCDQSTVHSDGTGQNLNSPEIPFSHVQGGLIPNGFAPKFSDQIRPVQDGLRKPQYVTWNTNSAAAPLMYPVDQMGRPGQNNNNSRSSSSSPRLFLSAPTTHKGSGALSTFSSPMFRTSPPQQSTLPQSAPMSTTCLSPPSYAMSFTSGISPTSAILTTLNIMPPSVSNNGPSYCSSEPPSLDMPLIPGFPNSSFIGSQVVQQPDLPPIMSDGRLHMVSPGQSDGTQRGPMTTEAYLHMQQQQQASQQQYSYKHPEQQQEQQHHVVQRNDRAVCPLEYSPSLLSSKSSSEGTSTGSPLLTIETTIQHPQPPSTQVHKEM